jgi:hypothetical protein
MTIVSIRSIHPLTVLLWIGVSFYACIGAEDEPWTVVAKVFSIIMVYAVAVQLGRSRLADELEAIIESDQEVHITNLQEAMENYRNESRN